MEGAAKQGDLGKVKSFVTELEEESERFLTLLHDTGLLSDEADHSPEVSIQKNLTPADIAEIKPLLMRMDRLLEQGDARAEDTMEGLKKFMSGFGFDEILITMENQIWNYDFEEARESLAEIRREINQPGDQSPGDQSPGDQSPG
jgi:hypothetical protein